ncbi:MAG TPA: DNA polymerase III subunit beta [Myxococcales bacterium]|jgi:DNA polymerase-3 subunit beta|nr:DNA polymerase III subunit beta [Myxococcales bacterium]
MEFRIAAEELAKALHRAQGIAERKTTIPILANVLIQAKKSGVSLTAFDLDIGLVSEHPAEVLREGAITLASKHLFDIVKALPESQVTVQLTGGTTVEISCGNARFKLLGMPAEEYPALPKEEKASLTRIDGRVLLEMIEKTSFAISTDETRYILNGLYFESPEPGAVRVVATDGHRLSLVARSMEGSELKLKHGVIIPRKGLFELRRLIDEAPDAECFLGFTDTSAIFKKSGLSMIMRLIDGQFPDYQEVIPQENKGALTLPRQRLLATLKRISLLSEAKSNAIKIELTENQLRVSSQNPDLGEAHEDLPVEYSGGKVEVGFNARYLVDVLSVVGEDDVSFEIVDDQSPGVVRPATDRGYTAVIMPMRI